VGYDTIGLSFPLTPERMEQINQKLIKKSAVDNATAEQLYEFFVGDLEGSFDNRISLRYRGDELCIEASVAKIKNGHNCFDTPQDWLASVELLVGVVHAEFGYIADVTQWNVRRIDYALMHNLGAKGVSEYLASLSLADFSRRKCHSYGDGVYYPSRAYTLKLYCKHTEYKKNSFKKLENRFPELAHEAYIKSSGKLRTEVEIRRQKLKYDFGHYPKVAEITNEYVKGVFNMVVRKLVKGGDINTMREVERVLRNKRAVYSTWCVLSTLGETYAKKVIPRTTLYTHKRYLKEHGITWLGSNVSIKERIVPADFMPLEGDLRLVI